MQLYKKKRRYIALLDTFHFLGKSAGENSVELIRRAGAIILIASKRYIERYFEDKDGNIALEVGEMPGRVAANVPIVPVALDSYSVLRDPHPSWSWAKVNPAWKNGAPLINSPLRFAQDRTVEQAVDAALSTIDKVHAS